MGADDLAHTDPVHDLAVFLEKRLRIPAQRPKQSVRHEQVHRRVKLFRREMNSGCLQSVTIGNVHLICDSYWKWANAMPVHRIVECVTHAAVLQVNEYRAIRTEKNIAWSHVANGQ